MSDNTSYLIRSTDRATGTAQSGNYSFITAGTVGPGTYELLSFQMNNGLYNVETGVNDEIYFDEGAVELGPVNLTAGNYTAATLLTEIIAQMNSVSGSNYNTSAYAAATGLYTIAITVGTFSFNWATNSAQPLANILMGFGVVDTALAASHISTVIADLTLHKNIIVDVTQDSLQNLTLLGGTEATFLVPIDLSSSFGGRIDFQKSEAYAQRMQLTANMNSLDIAILQESGTALPAYAVSEWTMYIRRLF